MILYPKSTQHVTAGPYSPVVGVQGDARIFVLSGQAPVNDAGVMVGADIGEQSHITLRNCHKQLAAAECDFSDVFKVTVYLTDLGNWPAFNDVYREYFKPPFPARTAIGCDLLPEFLVEIEMWAARS